MVENEKTTKEQDDVNIEEDVENGDGLSEEEKSTGDKLNEKKEELDYEFEYLHEKVGNNNRLINKAFVKLLDNNNIAHIEEDEEEDKLVGPPAPQFLQNTLNLLADEEDDAKVNEETKKEVASS